MPVYVYDASTSPPNELVVRRGVKVLRRRLGDRPFVHHHDSVRELWKLAGAGGT